MPQGLHNAYSKIDLDLHYRQVGQIRPEVGRTGEAYADGASSVVHPPYHTFLSVRAGDGLLLLAVRGLR